MLPILFSINSFSIYTLGFLLAVGFFLAAFIIWRRLVDLGLGEEKVVDLIILMGILGLLFSRIFYIFQNFEKFGLSPSRWIFLGRYPGLSFWGGVLGIVFGLSWHTKIEKWSFWRLGDQVVYGILPLFVLSQLGSFLDGSGQGKKTGMPWGIFSPGSLIKRQPLSLFFAILILLIWFLLARIERRWRIWSWYKSQADGFVFLVFLGLLFFSNLLLAFWRDSKIYFYWGEILLSFVGLVACGVLFYLRSGRSFRRR